MSKENYHGIIRILVLPTHGDGHYLGTADGARPVDHGYLQQIAQAADRLGFGGVLIPTGRSCEDAAGSRLADSCDATAAFPRWRCVPA